MASVYRKVMVADRLPSQDGLYFVIEYGNRKETAVFNSQIGFHSSHSKMNVTHWFEEIELPADGDIWGKFEGEHRRVEVELIKKGANFIKDHIEKGGKE